MVNKQRRDIRRILESTGGQPIVLFGAGARVSIVEPELSAMGVNYVIVDNDREKWGMPIGDTVVCSPLELADKYMDSYVSITVIGERYYGEIYRQLLGMGYSPEKMFDFRELLYLVKGIGQKEFDEINGILEDGESREVFAALCLFDYNSRVEELKKLRRDYSEHYFDPDVIRLEADEVFIDVGGFTGDTIEEFINLSGNRFDKILSFEPSEENRKQYCESLLNDPRIRVYDCGLGSVKSTARFKAHGSGSSICEDGTDTIQVERLDDILSGERASFIKMDIEGAELDALIGAEQTIRKYAPKLAVCVYHKDMDVFEIAPFIKKCVPEYRLYLRHYSQTHTETVLYAVND